MGGGVNAKNRMKLNNGGIANASSPESSLSCKVLESIRDVM